MKTATAKLNNLRISPRKVRLVADLIRRMPVEKAQKILEFTPKRATIPVLKLLNSAVANAKDQGMKKNLVVYRITVDEGRKMKRWRARAMGRANNILKRTGKITIVLKENDTQSSSKSA